MIMYTCNNTVIFYGCYPLMDMDITDITWQSYVNAPEAENIKVTAYDRNLRCCREVHVLNRVK